MTELHLLFISPYLLIFNNFTSAIFFLFGSGFGVAFAGNHTADLHFSEQAEVRLSKEVLFQ